MTILAIFFGWIASQFISLATSNEHVLHKICLVYVLCPFKIKETTCSKIIIKETKLSGSLEKTLG